uniref:Uncharacterized protein n=1 Tax=Photinus pyralis TaxID=7054 RepID=A0A1Y1NC07_PHOPY
MIDSHCSRWPRGELQKDGSVVPAVIFGRNNEAARVHPKHRHADRKLRPINGRDDLFQISRTPPPSRAGTLIREVTAFGCSNVGRRPRRRLQHEDRHLPRG